MEYLCCVLFIITIVVFVIVNFVCPFVLFLSLQKVGGKGGGAVWGAGVGASEKNVYFPFVYLHSTFYLFGDLNNFFFLIVSFLPLLEYALLLSCLCSFENLLCIHIYMYIYIIVISRWFTPFLELEGGWEWGSLLIVSITILLHIYIYYVLFYVVSSFFFLVY